MASLGKVCAVGIGANMLIAVFLLPTWWVVVSLKSKAQSPKSNGGSGGECRVSGDEGGRASRITHHASRITHPSSFYRVGLWRLGLAIVRILPAWLVKRFCVTVAELHFLFGRQRREVVVQNLLPALSGNRSEAEQIARRLYRNFASKLVDLWRVEGGVPVRDWLTDPAGLEIIRAARPRGRGILFITLHLGNWEHGGLLLAEVGIQLTVLTLAEPDDELTKLRMASRERWKIQTLIIGQDSFAFLEVIKRLQAGAALAISLDRPPQRSGVPVELFGHPFEASAGAAELARASGCALIGVTIVRRRAGFAVKVLPEFTYDRQALGNREARRQLTQQILRAFEPQIREDIDQWYQFVPIWPNQALVQE
jgi:KDO2-lipid IV(A) lauroyltransferase